MRTQRNLVTFRAAFKLNNFETPLPAGTYELSVSDEETDTMLSQGRRRVLTVLRTPALGRQTGIEQWTEISHGELDKALTQDAEAFPPLAKRQGDRIS